MSKAPRITRDEFRRKLEAKEEILILDVRNPVDYAASSERIPGAVRIPLEELTGRVKELDPEKEVVAYCT
ncbi:MAG: rhodanese-like domain-containing protein [Deltaproteobacteria bacterium]|nr:rhodanese-like domain-containing protein [Deltaproteobacteria bacterium]